MVDLVTKPHLLAQDINAFIYSEACPAALRDVVLAQDGVAADQLRNQARALYAHYDELNDAGKTAMAQVYQYCVHSRFVRWCEANHAETVVDYVSRDLGEQGAIKPPVYAEWPAPTFEEGRVDWRYDSSAVE